MQSDAINNMTLIYAGIDLMEGVLPFSQMFVGIT